MYNKVLETIEKYNMLSKGGNVVAGLSGGADSSAMVHILAALRDKFDINISSVSAISNTVSEAMRHIEMRKYHENSVKGSV